MPELSPSALFKKITSNTVFKNIPPLSDGNRKLLTILYRELHGPELDRLKQLQFDPKELKPPIIISFHPKLSLLNNNIMEAQFSELLAQKINHIPLWIPYLYDTAIHSAAEGGKIRAPTYAFFEGRFLQLRSATQIHGNIIKTEKAISKMEIDTFIRSMDDYIFYRFGSLHNFLDQYDYGHDLFPLKLKIMKLDRKVLKSRIEMFRGLMLTAAIQGQNLGESLGYISHALMKELGISINIAFIERVLPQLVFEVFKEITQKMEVKNDPSLLDGLFVHYSVKSKQRTQVSFTGDHFLAMDDGANRLFDGTLEELVAKIEKDEILPLGPLLILIFAALGCRFTFGGMHTQEYYPKYLSNATKLLAGTSFSCAMQTIAYGNIRTIDLRNMMDLFAVARVVEKVGSRSVSQRGQLTLPDDIVDHLMFMNGEDAVPIEYKSIIEKLKTSSLKSKEKVKDNPEKSPKIIKKTALEKETARLEQIARWNAMDPDALKKESGALKPFFAKLDFEKIHPERLKMSVENLYTDSEVRVQSLKENILFEQHILGGKLPKIKSTADKSQENEEDSFIDKDGHLFQEIFDGLWLRSKRVPTLLELAFYKVPIDLPFQETVEIKTSKTPHFCLEIIPKISSNGCETISTQSFTTFTSAFEALVPKKYLPDFFLY